MSDDASSQERRILRALHMTLANIVKDTTPQPGMLHPLSDRTIDDIRACFALISAREMELAAAAGLACNEKPVFADQPTSAQIVPITLASLRRKPGDATE